VLLAVMFAVKCWSTNAPKAALAPEWSIAAVVLDCMARPEGFELGW